MFVRAQIAIVLAVLITMQPSASVAAPESPVPLTPLQIESRLVADGVLTACGDPAKLRDTLATTIENQYYSGTAPQWTPDDFALFEQVIGATTPEGRATAKLILDPLRARFHKPLFSPTVTTSAKEVGKGSGVATGSNPTPVSGQAGLSYTTPLSRDSLAVMSVASLKITPGKTAFGEAFSDLTSVSELDYPVFLEYKHVWGLPLEILGGHFANTITNTGANIQFGPFGLLANTGGALWADFPQHPGVTGLWVRGGMCGTAPQEIQYQGAAVLVSDAEYAYGVNVTLRAGSVTLGLDTVWNQINRGAPGLFGATNAGWHVYGSIDGRKGTTLNPATPNCPAVGKGIECPAGGNGWGGYASVPLYQINDSPAVQFQAEYAQWTDTMFGGTDHAYEVGLSIDATTLFSPQKPKPTPEIAVTSIPPSPTTVPLSSAPSAAQLDTPTHIKVQLTYANFGTNFYAPYGTNPAGTLFYPGNVEGTLIDVIFPLIPPRISAELLSFSGQNIAPFHLVSQSGATLTWKMDQQFTFKLSAVEQIVDGSTQLVTYGAKVDYKQYFPITGPGGP